MIVIEFSTSVFYSDISRDLKKAAEAAFSERDIGTLDEILSKAGRQPELAMLVQQMKSRLGAT